jgi:hypothetical protein
VIEKLRGLRLTRAAELLEAAVEKTLTYYAFPEEHGALAADSHQQPPRAHPARDPAAHACARSLTVNLRSTCRRKAAPHRRHGVVRPRDI